MHRLALWLALALLGWVLVQIAQEWQAVGLAQARAIVAPYAPHGDASGMRLGPAVLALLEQRCLGLAGYLGLILLGFVMGAMQGLDWRMSQHFGGFYAVLWQWALCLLVVALCMLARLVLPPAVAHPRLLLIGLVAAAMVGGFLVLAGMPARAHRS